MPRLRPRGPEPGRGRTGLVASLRFPGLAITATPVGYQFASAALDMPGLDLTARVTLVGTIAATELDMPGLAVVAGLGGYTLASATLAMPGLSLRADTFGAALSLPGLAVPKCIVSVAPGLGATLVMPGLAVPKATVGNVAPIVLRAALAMPGLGVTAAADSGAGQFRLAPDYRLDWAKLQGIVAPSVVQIGSPVSNGVRMSGGPGGPEAVGNVLLASRNKTGPGWSGVFTLKRTDAYAPAAGNGAAFLILYFGAVGDGGVAPLSGYYVDPVAGSDANAGTSPAAPWATIAKAQTGRVGGDVVYLRGGTYRTTTGVTLSTSGAAGNPVTYKRYPGETPVLNACLPAYETAGNTAWTPHDAATNTYKTTATLASDIYCANLQYTDGNSYALNRYANLAWLMSTNYVYSSAPTNYYRGPGFFYNAADSKLYIRLENLTGARAVDLDQGNGAIPAGFDFAIPSNPDPRLYGINVSRFVDVLTVNGSNIVWDGIEVRGGHRAAVIGGDFFTFQNATAVDAQITFNISGNNHDILFLQCPRLDSGFFSPWAPWAEIKTLPQEAADQKRSLCTQSGNSFNIEFRQCRIGRYFDGFTAKGHGLKIINCDAEYILDDGMQCDTDAYDVYFCRNYWRGPILTNNGNVPQTVNINSKLVIGNIIDNTRYLPGYLPEFYCRASHPSAGSHTTWRYAHDTVLSHSDQFNTGSNPHTYLQNTVIYALNDNADGCGFQRECRGSGVQEVYNNIIMARDKTKSVKGGDTRDGGEFRNGNDYWRQGAPTLEPMFTVLQSASAPSGASYNTLALWKSSAPGIASGWEALSVEADPLFVDLPNQDFRLQGGSPARTGFVDLSGRGWPFLEAGTHAGAVAPGAVDPLGTCGATFFRVAAAAAVPAARAQLGPYPWSALWDPLVLTGNATAFARGADQHLMTRTPTDTLLDAWGDGFGWLDDQTKSFLGITEISGTPPLLTGVNRFQDKNLTSPPNRKPNAILALGGSTVLLWHVNQTLDGRAGTYTAISTDGGSTFTFHEAAGERVFSTGGSPPLQVIGAVQAGPSYVAQSSGMDVTYAHLYLNNSGNLANPFTGTNGTIWLCRVKISGTGGAVANIWNPAKYSFFNGLDGTGAPTWTADGGSLDVTKSVFVNPVGMGKHFQVGWSEVNKRFFGALTPTPGTLAVYEAPARWGPWGTLYYGPGSDPAWTGIFTASVPGPWQSTSKLWLAVSGGPDELDVQSSPLAPLTVSGFPADLAQWPASFEPFTTPIAAHITGARLTFFFNNNALGVDPVPSVPSLAVFNADTSVTSIAADSSPAGLAQARNFPYDYTLALSTASPPVLTLTQFDASTGLTRTITWTSVLLNARASPSAGAFAWLCPPGRVVEITGESFTPPGGAVPHPSATLVMPGLGVSAQVDAGSVSTGWSNGYAKRELLALAAQPDLAGEALVDFPAFLDTTEVPGDWSWLVTANGKLLSFDVDGTPLDIRFELTDGTKLDHMLASFDGTLGQARFFLHRPTGAWRSDATNPLAVFYGQAGLTATEEQVANVWRGARLVIDPTSGLDLTGRGRALTRFGSPVDTTLDGRPATTLPGGSKTTYLRRTAPDLVATFDGWTEVTEKLWAKVSSSVSDSGSRLGGDGLAVPAQPFPHARFTWWVEAIGTTSGSVANVIQVGAQWWNGKYNSQSTESDAGVADGSLRHLIVVHRSGQFSKLYDGETDVSHGPTLGTAVAGTMHVQASDNFSLGAGTGTQDTSPAITFGLYEVWPHAFSATERAMRDRTERDGRQAWGHGAADLVDDATTSPVAVPYRATLVGDTTIDVAALAFDDQSPRAASLVSVTADARGNSRITASGGKVLVSPNAGVSLVPSVADYVIGKGLKRSTARLYLTVSGGVIIGGSSDGIAPAFPASTATIKGPVSVGQIQATYNALTAAEIAGGATILVTPGSSGTVNLTLAKSGLKGNGVNNKRPQFPIIIRVGTLSGGRIADPASFPSATLDGKLTLSGDFNWFRGFQVNKGVSSTGTGNRTNRCYFTGANPSGNLFIDTADSLTFDWCEISNHTAVGLYQLPSNGAMNSFIYRSYFHDQAVHLPNSGTHHMLGTSLPDDRVDSHIYTLECVYGVGGTAGEGWECKSSSCIMERCANTTDGAANNFVRSVVRHGHNNQMLALWTAAPPDKGDAQGCRGDGNIIADTVATNGCMIGPFSGDTSYADWVRTNKASGAYPTGENTILVRIAHPTLGANPSAGTLPPTGTILEQCGTPTLSNPATKFITRNTVTIPPRTDPGAVRWRVTGATNPQVGPTGRYTAGE